MQKATNCACNRLRVAVAMFLVLGAGELLEAQGVPPRTTMVTVDERGAVISRTDGSGGPAHHPSRILVRFRNGARAAFLPGSGAARSFPAEPNLYLVENPPGLSVAEAVRRYGENPNVLYAEPDYEVSTITTPSDPLWSQQWDMVKIAAPEAWDIRTGADDVVVAVIDTGVDFSHPDLQGNLWTNPSDGSHGFTCVKGACVPGGQDDQGHGTHVAGTIGALGGNGIGMAGLNWRAQILSCKFLDKNGSGSISDAVLCFNQILLLKPQGFNIRVTNNSWGGGGFSQALKDAMSDVEGSGIVNVCAAGNGGVNADVAPMYPAAYDNRGLVSVLASDQSDVGASFTNYGVANVDIAAPGVATLSTVPTGSCALCDPSGYKRLWGTSMAAPHVSGVLAAMLHANPALTAYEVRDALLDPSSYDLVAEQKAGSTATGGRLNFLKALTSPLVAEPKLNSFPQVGSVSNVFAKAGDRVNLTATASDPDGDPLRIVWSRGAPAPWLLGSVVNTIFPSPTGDWVSFQAPSLARTAMAPYAASAADGRGGGSTAVAYATILPSSTSTQPPSGTLLVSPTSGPVGTVVSVSFPAVDAAGTPAIWDVWHTTVGRATGRCCLSGATTDITFDFPGAFRLTVQAVDSKLNFSKRQSAVVRIGGASGTPPIANATFDQLSGAAPLTVNIDMTASSDPDGTIQSYLVLCDFEKIRYGPSGSRSSCVYDTPGTYWMMLQVKDNDGLLDLVSAYVTVTPPGGSSPVSKQPATVTLSNMIQTYTGSALTPTATTNPPGLAITWTNAPQTAVGSYAVTATVNDPNYQGSATGTFTINKAAASVTLSNMIQTYTGSPLAPTATTNPQGLAITWTNAPQTKVGSYLVTAKVNDPNYQGSADGTFTITPAPTSSTPPSVSITNPLGGTVPRSSKITIEAAAIEGTNPLARVDFLVNASVKCSDAAAPYTCSWSVPAAPGKNYQLQAKAYDTGGNVGASAIVTVTSSR